MFRNDPFFANHRAMMDSFFGESAFAVEGNQAGHQDRRGVERRQERRIDPFEDMHRHMNDMMSNFGRGMMESNFGNGNDGHVFSHSSVYSYSSDGQGPPKVYQAAREERRGPGGIRETKKALKDSESGLQKMAVGRHMGERGHVIERSQNFHTGDREEHQNFVGMTEEDGTAFHDEWSRATQGHARHQRRAVAEETRDGRRGHRGQRALPATPRDQMLKVEGRRVKGDH